MPDPALFQQNATPIVLLRSGADDSKRPRVPAFLRWEYQRKVAARRDSRARDHGVQGTPSEPLKFLPIAAHHVPQLPCREATLASPNSTCASSTASSASRADQSSQSHPSLRRPREQYIHSRNRENFLMFSRLSPVSCSETNMPFQPHPPGRQQLKLLHAVIEFTLKSTHLRLSGSRRSNPKLSSAVTFFPAERQFHGTLSAAILLVSIGKQLERNFSHA